MKILATDLDGTLIREQKILQKDLEALKNLKENGNKIIIATGRDFKGVEKVVEEFPIDYDYLVLCNGGIVMNKDNEIIHNKSINFEIKNAILKDYYNEGSFLIYFSDDNTSHEVINNNIDLSHLKKNQIKRCPSSVGYKEALSFKDDYRIITLFESALDIEHAEKVKNEIALKYGEYVEAYRNQMFIDIVPKNCSKGNGIKMILEDKNYSTDDLYTIGDSHNDITMFNLTKNSYTFNNAEDEVKNKAENLVDYVYEAAEEILNLNFLCQI